MDKRTRLLGLLAVMAALVTSSPVGAGRADQRLAFEPYGVGVTPAVYLVNFMLMYIANPNEAANMPAFRAPVPSSFADCLHTYPTGCP